jgi:AmmeMemoRadiSam system protein A
VRIRSAGENRTIAGPDGTLTAADRAALLALARQAIEAALRGDSPPSLPDVPGAAVHRGAFVTLETREDRELRGCVGHVAGDRPLGEIIRRVAVSAAREDPRFSPVTPDELRDLRIEVSVLDTPVRVSPVEPQRVVIGRDGLLVRRGRVQGLLLPRVATEQGWSADAFLEATCHKAGLPRGSWKEPATEVFTFTADSFVE